MPFLFQGPSHVNAQTGSTTRTANSFSTTSIGDGSSFDVCNLQNLGFIQKHHQYMECNMCIHSPLTNDMTDWDLRMVSIGGGRSTFLFRSFRSWMTVGISLNICFLDNGGLFTLFNSTLTSVTHYETHYVWNWGYDDGWFDVESGFIFIRNDS